MFIDGVNVVGVVQPHASQAAKLRNERAEHAATMHRQKRLVDAVLPFQNIEERQIGGGRAAKLVIDEIEVLPQQLASFMAYFAAVLLCVVEDADEIVRLCPEDFRFGNVEMAARNADSFAQSSSERH